MKRKGETMPCKYKMYDNKECGRSSYGGSESCIAHLQDRRKDLGKFKAVLKQVLTDKNPDYLDLTGFCFPKGEWRIETATIKKKIYLDGCTLWGDLIFRTHCEDEVSFKGTRFLGVVNICPMMGGRNSQNTGISGNANSYPAEERRIQFQKDVVFDHCTFEGSLSVCVSFSQLWLMTRCTFQDDVKFYLPVEDPRDRRSARFELPGCIFNGDTNISIGEIEEYNCNNAEFNKTMTLNKSSILSQANFQNSTFKDKATFSEITFGSGKNKFKGTLFEARFDSDVSFESCQFNSPVEFGGVRWGNPQYVNFKKSDLSGARFNDCEISKVRFKEVRWNKQKSRNRVFDELWYKKHKKEIKHEESYLEATAQTYRQLQENYGETYRYPEAGDFYIGEQEMVRRLRQVRGERSLSLASNLYKWVANYGESILRPLIWLVSVLAFSPIILGLIGGIGLEDGGFAVITIDSVASACPADQTLLVGNYFSALNANVDFVFFQRSTGDKYLSWTVQRLFVKAEFVLVATFITFILLALRRKFKRKSF